MNTNTQTTITQITPAQFEEAMRRYAAAGLRGLEINKAIEAEMNEVLAQFESDLYCVQQEQQQAWETMKAYCSVNKKQLFGKRRSIGTPFGVAGFRLGTPRLKSPKGTSWNSVVEKLKEKLPAYVRTFDEPAKDLLLADRHKDTVAPLLQEMGVQVVQDELFYIETKYAA